MEIVHSLREAIQRSPLKNDMRISFHHHLRMGDRVVAKVLAELSDLGFKNLTLCVSSIMGEACSAVYEAVQAGVVSTIETTGMKEPLSTAVTRGDLANPVLFRTHGGRARAIEEGDTPIDVAFIAASVADYEGNLDGRIGKNAFGSMGYAIGDATHSSFVVGITDFLTDKPLETHSISKDFVDLVVLVDSIGDRELLSGGSLRSSRNPLELLIAQKTLQVLQASGALQEGFNYQAGSGGISLLVTTLLHNYMSEQKVVGGFASGGITGSLVAMAKEGLFHTLWDVQSFDHEAVLSLATNSFHKEMSASLYANPNNPDCIAQQLDVMILSATEVDVAFNVNSVTGTDGRILGALGGGPDTAHGSKLTVVVLPSFRGRIPTITPRLNALCTLGSDVDAVITERGIAINPSNEPLYQRILLAGIPTVSLEELMSRAHRFTGVPTLPKQSGSIVGIIEDPWGKERSKIFGV